jgi:uncharacterized membrane protein (UPF0127 family)
MKRFARILILGCLLVIPLFSGGCHHQPTGLPVTTLSIGSQNFTLEIATTDPQKTLGLMHRESLAADHGMIFLFGSEAPRTFWNHDVHFPLDLLFLGKDGTIVSIKRMESYSDLNVSSDVPAEYVIELNAGTADKLKVKVGDHLTLPDQVTSAPRDP